MKIFKIFLALWLLANVAFAQNLPQPAQPLPSDNFFVIDDFSKLLYSHANPYSVVHGEATDAYNVRANEQYGSLVKRPALNLYGTCSHSAAVTGLYRYYKSDATKYTISTSDVYLDYVSDSGACTNLYASLTAGKRTNFVTYKNWLIGTNGYDAAIKWDGNSTVTADTAGARTSGDSVTQLGAPFAKIAAGVGLTASRWYQYRMAFYDGTNYKYTTARSNPLLLGVTNKQIALTDIPLGPPGTTHRYLYRTVGDTTRANVLADNTFYRVTDIADNATTTYTDSSSDATIGADVAPTWATVSAGVNVTPPKAIYPFIHKDYLWLADDVSGSSYGQSTVYFSQVLNPDYWVTGTNYFLIRPDDGDVVTGITSFLGDLHILKTNSISKIYTNNSLSTAWTVSQPFSWIGAVAPYSISSTPLGILYLGRYGLYRFDGQQASLISDVVTKDIRDINSTNLSNVAAMYYNNEYRLAYASQATGSGGNDRVLLFDTVRNSFIKDTENVNVWAVFGSSDDFGGLYSGSSNTDGKILSHSTQPTSYSIRYLSDLNNGTFSATYAYGDETTPVLSLGSSAWSANASAWNSESASTWLVDSSPGTWTSPIVQVNANALSKLYWNATLPSGTTITFAVRTASTSGGIAGASWSSEYSNPEGSDISGVSANTYLQLRATLSTSNFATTPTLNISDNFLIKLVYSQVGSAAETSVNSSWTSGWLDLVPSPYQFYLSNYPKTIKEIDFYYEGTSGTMAFNFYNLKGTNSLNISVDLSRNALDSPSYWGYGNQKVFRWLAPASGSSFVGDKFLMNMTETGVTPWKLQRVAIRWDTNPYVPYRNN